MQYIAVDVVGPEMLERTGQRLRDLSGEAYRGIVGQAVILSTLVSELGLEKDICASEHASGVCGRQSFSHSSFVIMAALVGCVDAPKSRSQSHLSQGSGAIFFPGGSIEKSGNRDLRHGRHCDTSEC